ncbi:pentatricopeptide repeat-containing protein At1g04840-like [Tripterygium wilfordii]|uniref:pentatricopeptide repeat-containing protein At1g04840-like n=1 Tax=Tripterygium wilfordii TaxID=458696 RepID=UPI0018F812EB|nr:pentatricopeptide repeat-containing protein At1g04840-like [Tripterygium wilfordii]XP_038712631.1 pentatricopeptide repeat-containing protein At1g04840-like [Tripterygium wilfordii]XP_038712632.1 pentatricopeptide repeat-containing protein At1g04840-like [Tripterygium wilfordii]XP_038712633.1 pentatricopeptide repeat-containing protein At1g04840-like [Tripterygium wilfordii]XP_038712634.1 pentatricopeptide repeat-containing protein At1g04840-like [Tripterygium wilfordii]XP_038712635.1 penta
MNFPLEKGNSSYDSWSIDENICYRLVNARGNLSPAIKVNAMASLRVLSRPNTPAAMAMAKRPNSLSSEISQNPIETQFISLIHSSKNTLQLYQIHAKILRLGLVFNSRITTQLISASSLLKSVDYAICIFRQFEPKNTFSFNALIRGLTENSRFESSISHFGLMLRLNVKPDRLTYPFILKSAAALCWGRIGGACHGGILKCGIEFDSFVRVSLVDMYVKVEELGLAFKLFDESPETSKSGNILLWNVLINGCCKVGKMKKAMELFEAMPERSLVSWNSLINGLLRNGDSNQAWKFFDLMPEKNVVSWTTMVNGLLQNGDLEQSLKMFFRMLEEGVRPNELTIVSALSACARIGALKTGVQIHNYISNNAIRLNGAIGTALVDMYAKCGNIEHASKVFGETKDKDILTWTAMIWGWAIHGCFEQAIQCFKHMMYAGIKPDGIAFLAILTACSHSGQVNLGLNFFDSMTLDYSIEPTMKHYTLMVDLLGRAGQLKEALSFIESMPVNPDFVVWGALFCACRAHKNIEMAELASKKLLELEPKHHGNYVFLSNVYAAVGRWEDVERVRTLMQNRSFSKDPGWSYIEVGGHVHSFMVGDSTRENADKLYLKLEEVTAAVRLQGYRPETKWVLHNIEEEEKEGALGSHSEKLALAFGLLHTSPGMTIRIMKNLRICGDCHAFMKYASKVSQREIVVRDIKRFHHFREGTCSCREFW